jgi:predicted enzyme related to lactoylglutathione lyase
MVGWEYKSLACFQKNLSRLWVSDGVTLRHQLREDGLMANSVAHFEIFAGDVERTRRFYENVFGWRFEVGGPPDFYLIVTGPETDRGLTHGLIAKRSGAAAQGPINSFRCTVSVCSIENSMVAIQTAGGKLRSPVINIPGVGKVVEFADTDGNIACIMEYVSGHPFAAQ